jgi:hypothetical protein
MRRRKGERDMTREQKYPDTSTFHFYNANPKNRITGDCIYRALCTAMNIPYNQVVMHLAELQCKTGYADEKLYGRYLELNGWIKHKQPRKADGTKYTGKEFCERARTYENYIAHIGGHHIVAIVDGKVNDIWNSTGGCIGNYWTKG